jgi:hypothetical protein
MRGVSGGVGVAVLVLALGAGAGEPVRRAPVVAQVAPTAAEVAAYAGLHAAAARGDAAAVRRLLVGGADPNARDGHQRTPLHVAAHGGQGEVARLLVDGGADANALDARRYDVVTIAAVRDDVAMVRLALALGGRAGNVTSPYDGTALIAAAHLGHAGVVRELIRARAPLDHVNNLGWTALIEAVILGDGGPRHVDTVRALVEAGARLGLADRDGVTPLAHARRRGFTAIVEILQRAGAR